MSRTLLATICLSTAMMGGENTAASADTGGIAPPGLQPQAWTDHFGPLGFDDRGPGDGEWLAGLTTSDAMLFESGANRQVRSRILFRSSDETGSAPYGAAAALDFGFLAPGFAEPDIAGFPARPMGHPDTVMTATLSMAAGLRFDAATAGAFSNLTYVRSSGGGHGSVRPNHQADALMGSVGLQSTARLDTPMGIMEPQFRLSLDHDFGIGDGIGGPLSGAGRQNIYVEERDVTEFDLDNAISLRMKGIVPGWFHYETRIRVRTTGIREITGRIRFKW